MRHNIRIGLRIRFETKWHAGSGEGGLLLDRLIRRDSRNWPYIPGSTLKGVVRENCERLSRTLRYPEPSNPHETDLTVTDAFRPLRELESPVDKIFGNKFESGRLFFRDARLLHEPPHRFLKHQSRICKYRMLGTVRERHLFSSEYAEPLELATTIDGYHDHLVSMGEELPPYAYCILIAGIMLTDRIGGDKSTGGGNVRILFDSILCDGKPLEKETVFEYLDSEFYDISKEEG